MLQNINRIMLNWHKTIAKVFGKVDTFETYHAAVGDRSPLDDIILEVVGSRCGVMAHGGLCDMVLDAASSLYAKMEASHAANHGRLAKAWQMFHAAVKATRKKEEETWAHREAAMREAAKFFESARQAAEEAKLDRSKAGMDDLLAEERLEELERKAALEEQKLVKREECLSSRAEEISAREEALRLR